MGTIRDYIKWRGDLEFERDSFNVIDNLILSVVSYVEMDGLFDSDEAEPHTIAEISKAYFADRYDEKKYKEGSVLYDAPLILRDIANTRRFRKVKVQNYLSLNDTKRTLQFAAMEFLLPDGTGYVAFRGTDDTLVGWKEDFMLAVRETEAEKEAASYINRIASTDDRPLILGGHSKGGHLAVFAAAECDGRYRDRIMTVYSNDGPGFTEVYASGKAIRDVTPKLISIIPEDSIVGLLMKPVVKPIVVKSTAKYAYQHNPASWCLEGTKLDHIASVSKTAKYMDKLLKDNLGKMTPEELDVFAEDLFAVFESTGAMTVTELKKGGLRSLRIMAAGLRKAEKGERGDGSSVHKLCFHEGGEK
ncbi:MAG: DUF2974 domain-containing protein [Lachnospiraceae bacterium]|nr:DUF2974 domain-containing protein [Lachnospiraceae bacterium]